MLLYTCKEDDLQVTRKGERRAMNEMNENEMKQVALEKFAAIQRIKKYGKEELEYQEKLVRAELHNLGISTEDLELSE